MLKRNYQFYNNQNINHPNCRRCKRNNWLEFDKGWHCQNREYNIGKSKHQCGKKFRRRDHDFPTRLPYANKKIREIYVSMAYTTYISTEDTIDNLQGLRGKTKLEFYKKISKI